MAYLSYDSSVERKKYNNILFLIQGEQKLIVKVNRKDLSVKKNVLPVLKSSAKGGKDTL
jgi:hypothetical protein